MKSLLPNCRFLALASEHFGRDYSVLTQKIDAQLEELGMDLAEESVYLLFDRSPGAILNEEGSCSVARSVIGPKKKLDGDLRLFDWIQAPVHRKPLLSSDWDHILEECYQEWENLQRNRLKLAPSFMIKATRRLNPDLVLGLEVLFQE